jgi:hypothetical protein
MQRTIGGRLQAVDGYIEIVVIPRGRVQIISPEGDNPSWI